MVFSSCLSAVYRGVTGIRNDLYDRGILKSFKSRLPVISVGNLTAGGNGKTPLCIFLANEFLKKGKRPVILTRGYGGSEGGPYSVQSGDLASKVGDEALLLSKATKIPVVISKRRALGAKHIDEHNLGDLIILDDGFQHRRLARDLDIVCIYCGGAAQVEQFKKGELLPKGLFREDRDRALRRTGLVVLTNRGAAQSEAATEIRKLLPEKIAVITSELQADQVESIVDQTVLKPCNVIAFCGIANPQGFPEILMRLGFSVRASRFFRDHHPFKNGEVAKLHNEYPNTPLVCTEKDAVKLSGNELENVYVLKTHSQFEAGDRAVLLSKIEDSIKSKIEQN